MLTQARLKELLHYDPKTGVFTRISYGTWGPKNLLGRPAGNRHCRGYTELRLDGKAYLAHRLAWFYMTGKWPKEETDHINGVRHDNRWSNLREATKSFNMQNRHGPDRDNKLGMLGVSKHGLMYRAHIQVNKKHYRLGSFATPELAHEAYLKAKRKLHAGCTI